MRHGLRPVVAVKVRVDFQSNDEQAARNDDTDVVNLYEDGSAVVRFWRVRIRKRVYGGVVHIARDGTGGVVTDHDLWVAMGETKMFPVTDAARRAGVRLAERMYRRAVWEVSRKYWWTSRRKTLDIGAQV